MFRILVAEDDEPTRLRLERILCGAGYEPLLASDGVDALNLLDRKYADLAVIDLLMPRLDGYGLLDQLRSAGSELPVLIHTCRQGIADKRRCFTLGADDYLTKPADDEEILLRVAALLRRARISAAKRLTVGSTVLRYDAQTVTVGERVVELPFKEFMLLYKLLSCPNKIFTRRQLMDEIWDLASESGEHTVNVHINRLRQRFRGNPDFRIMTIRGLGYKAVWMNSPNPLLPWDRDPSNGPHWA